MNVLRNFSGKQEDLLELHRRGALEAMRGLERGEDAKQHLETLIGVKPTVGSAKKWPDGGLANVKEALKGIRELAKKYYAMATLELGESDQQLAQMLPPLREAFELVSSNLADAKRRARVLDYSDLETHALKILRTPEAREYYAERWKAFLVDEFQDTNPVQAELLSLLTERAILTIVGDEKQSIYGFRRADATVFQRFRKQILNDGGMEKLLTLSFRTHLNLSNTFNRVFAPVLGPLHQPLTSHRADEPHCGPHLSAHVVEADRGVNKLPRQRAEARHLAERLKRLLEDGTIVHDKETNKLRAMRPGDIAILSRTWHPLETYGEALASVGIPAVHAGGGSLLDTRECKDALALLRFLSDPLDDLALATVLRSPFFAISDRVLFTFARKLQPGEHWWDHMESGTPSELDKPAETLRELLKARRTEAPCRLLQLASRLTGYCAVIANLPNAVRREADWRGFLETITKWERVGVDDVFTLTRHLKRLIEAEVELERPPLEAQNAVSLMTIHAAKGLEWPVVVVPDLSRAMPNVAGAMHFDPEYGVALKLVDGDGEALEPALYTILEKRRKAREDAEARRVLYVALTRARDRVLLTSTAGSGGGFNLLQPGLDAADVPVEGILFKGEDALPQPLPETDLFEYPITVHDGGVNLILSDLPITALTEYAQCPLRFRYRYIDGHPGLGEGPAIGRRVGKLTHKAIELEIKETKALYQYDPTLPEEYVEEALELATRFHEDAVFSPFREQKTTREQLVSLRIGNLTLQGIVDLLGQDFVMDFKSDQELTPQQHRFQLWAYAQAAGHKVAHIAYLRHGQVHTFLGDELASIGAEADILVEKIQQGYFDSTPSRECCDCCAFSEICDDKYSESLV